MKLFCIVLVIYVLTLSLCGVDGRGGGTTKGLEEPKRSHLRARRLAPEEAAPVGTFANEEPPPPPKFRSRRNAMSFSNDPEDEAPHVADEAPHLRKRRQGPPPPPEGMPPPPKEMPPPPS